jgi:hypothetical protein
MQPFLISEASRRIISSFPDAEILKESTRSMTHDERIGLLRLWVSEGIPFAFSGAPMLYESIRGWLASRLEIHPKTITLIGSARLGYSLAPSPKYGRPFGETSDLDFSAITPDLFTQLAADFERWQADLTAGTVHPRSSIEENYWKENGQRLPKNIANGFIDPNKIPLSFVIQQRKK